MVDFRYALRMLTKSPGLTLAVVCLLAIAIGANTAIFTALNAILLRPLRVKHPEQLVRFVQSVPRVGVVTTLRYEFYDSLKNAQTVTGVIGWTELPVVMDDPKPAEQIRVHVVTPDFFDELGVSPIYGRTFAKSDDIGDAAVAVLSYSLWKRRFAGDPGILGSSLRLRRHKFTIVGILPETFNGITVDTAPDVRIPLRALPLVSSQGIRPDQTYLEIAARLRRGASLQQAQAECLSIWRNATEQAIRRMPGISEDFIRSELSRGLQVESIALGASVLRERLGLALQLFAGSAGLLLLLLCSNVGSLLLLRTAARREEIAVRLALGASRPLLVRQLLTESALLAGLGALGGWLLALLGTPMLARLLPPMRDRATIHLALALDLAPDYRVLLFAIFISAGTAILIGVAPALAGSRVRIDAMLRSANSSKGNRAQGMLVFFQIALCTLLLAGAGLLVRSLRQLNEVDTGFDRDHVVTFTVSPTNSGYSNEEAEALRRALLDRVQALPGAVAVATASRALMRGSGIKMTIVPVGRKSTFAEYLNTSVNAISPSYFETMGMRLISGRSLKESDKGVKPFRVVVNRAFAEQLFPGENPLGQKLGNPPQILYEIVGVVGDAKYRSLREPMVPTMYNLPTAGDAFVLYVRAAVQPEGLIQPVRRVLASLDPSLPFVEVHTLAEEVRASTASERLTATLTASFAWIAAILAAIGIYGLLAYGVAQRHREIGIRIAIGAMSTDIGWLIGRQVFLLVVAGTLTGLAAAWAVAPVLRSLLYGIAPRNAASIVGAAAFMLLVSAIASAIPTVRATRVRPASALRNE